MLILGREFDHISKNRYELALGPNVRLVLRCTASGLWVADVSGDDDARGYGDTPKAAILNLFEMLGEALDDHRRESMHRDMYERAMQRHIDFLEDLCNKK